MATEVSGIGGLFVTAGKSTGAMTKNDSIDADFSSFMNLNSYHQNAFANNYAVSQDNAKAGIGTASDQNVSYDKYQYKKSTVIPDASQKTYSKEELQAVEEKITEFSESVKDILKEKLSVTEEDIVSAMSTLQFSFYDLLDPQNLAALVTELTGCENPMQLLMTDNFQSVVTAVEEVTKQLLDELGMTKEEFVSTCEAIVAQNTEDVALQEEIIADTLDDGTAKGKDEANVALTAVDDAENAEKVSEKTNTVIGKQAESLSKPAGEKQIVKDQGQAKETIVVTQEKAEEQTLDSGTESEKDETSNFLKESKTTIFAKDEHAGQGIVFEQKVQPVATPDGNTTVVTTSYTNVSDMIEQISEYTRILISEGRNSLEMQLNPENLGKIYIHVSEKAGAITAQISASNESVKEAIQAQIVNLKESLSQQGIKVEAVEVTIESHEFEQNLEENAKREQNNAEQNEKNASKARRNININDLDALSGIMSEEENLVAKMMQENGNQMDVIV